MAEFIISTRGKEKLVYEGYAYTKQKNLASNRVAWVCEARSLCKARVTTDGLRVVKSMNQHTHAPNQSKIQAAKAQRQMKARVQETNETIQQILTETVGDLDEGAGALLPNISDIRRVLRKQRVAVAQPEPQPQNAREMEIPERYRQTIRGELFLQYDSGLGDENRILVFSTQRNLELLEHCDQWFADGTFKTVPQIFFQLYTIHVLLNDSVTACVYALLPNKTQDTYACLFQVLRQLQPDVNPNSIMMDMERAAANAATEVFPNVQIQYCFFHVGQAVWRKIQETGLAPDYREDQEFALSLRMLTALAFVPVDDVVEAFEALEPEMPHDAEPIVRYFESTYIGERRRQGRRFPTFHIDKWNVYERTVEDLPRTNNAIEGWHRGFQSNVGAFHPNIWKFLDVLRREQGLNELKITQALTGHEPVPQRRTYRDCQLRISAIVRDYENRDILNYLRAIGHNLSM